MSDQPMLDPNRDQVICLSEETKYAEHGIVSRNVFRTATCRVVLFGFAEGQELSEHTSTSHALVQILSGTCEFALNGKWHTLQAGNFLNMPPGLPHAIKATGAFSMLLTLIKPDAATHS